LFFSYYFTRIKTSCHFIINQGIFYKNKSQEHKTIALYHEALEKCKLIPDDFRTKAVVLVNMGNTYNNIGSYNKSIETMKQVLKVADSLEGSYRVKAAALIGLCVNYTKLNNYDKILNYAKQAEFLGKKNNDEYIIASALNTIATTYISQGKYKESITISNEALKLKYLQKTTRKRALILLNLGNSYFKLEQFNKAIPFLKESKKIAIEKDILYTQMNCHMYLAKIYEQKGDYKNANLEQKAYAKTLKIKKKLQK